MPYLRMFLHEQLIDDVFIPEVLLNSVLSLHIIEEEKQNMLKRHAGSIRSASTPPVFYIDSVPSAVNHFTPLDIKKGSQ
jgi:hypothetical protein